jgi:Ca2+-transporting ATPase
MSKIALLGVAYKSGFDRAFCDAKIKKIGEFPFDSDRKRMSALFVPASESSTLIATPVILAKGAPESLLSRCTHYAPAGCSLSELEQRKVPIDDASMNLISAKAQAMASNGLRVLGLAARVLESTEQANDILAGGKSDDAEVLLVFCGLVGLIDPPRTGVKESVTLCKKAGIKVIMITGDHIVTAMAIATSLGILEPHNPKENRAIKGVELDMLSDEALMALLPFPNVFARVRWDLFDHVVME